MYGPHASAATHVAHRHVTFYSAARPLPSTQTPVHIFLSLAAPLRFHILGGECNYLVRVVPGTYHLEMVPDEDWKDEEMMSWKEEDIKELLDNAEALIRQGAARLRLPVKVSRSALTSTLLALQGSNLRTCCVSSLPARLVPCLLDSQALLLCLSPPVRCFAAPFMFLLCSLLSGLRFSRESLTSSKGGILGEQILRKERAVGAIPMAPTIYEVLEDLAITVQTMLIGSKVPYCAFNGGNDVFVDVGNKNYGMMALQRYFGAREHEVMHVGDRFTQSGNDAATRDCCAILWVANPEETAFFMKLLLSDIHKHRNARYVE